PKEAKALAWMGFEARRAILDVLDAAIADHEAEVCVIAYDLNEPEIVSRLKKLGTRLRVIVVDGPTGRTVVCGSTNFSWRGLYVQNNNALVLQGATAVAAYRAAFEAYWQGPPRAFRDTDSAKWTDLGLTGIDARVAFSPQSPSNALLATIAEDIGEHTTSSLLFS